MEERIDVLLTTYNSKIEYLKIQIDSILNQTHSNFKLIISDDYSTHSEVRKVLEEYAKKDNRIELYFQEHNLGYTKNFEFVLTKSSSEYIAFADHDDFWYPNKLEESIKTLKEKGVSLVYSDARQIDENDNLLHESYLRYKNMPILNENYYKEILPFSRHIAIGCSQLFTKQVKEKMLPFTENTMAHDWHSLYIASNLNGIYCIDKPLFDYRLHKSNAYGGRSLKINIKKWKKENGNTYKSYLKYRYKVITQTYLAGVLMCREYRQENEPIRERKNENEVIKYFKNAQNKKIIYFSIHKYYKYLYFKGIGKRANREIMILHFPLLSYLLFKLI